ncbi:Hsp20/alpha crystallin family protein [Bdellovibrio sp. HCB185ZH]|uniref:Hsp20/alpha crystallin family protein n=1 Tax=Bdellovibrio sp. HCB185ZH TaxID=3394235 RepID=UPI0039A40DA9
MRMLTTTPYWTTRNLASGISSMFDEMEHLTKIYDDRDFTPACDLTENDTHYFMSMDVPGLQKDDIKIDITNNLLTVSGERKRATSNDSNRKFQLFERRYGFFKRSFSLPSSIESAKVEARYENGVLELYLPKTETARPRKIEIQDGKSGIFERLIG